VFTLSKLFFLNILLCIFDVSTIRSLLLSLAAGCPNYRLAISEFWDSTYIVGALIVQYKGTLD